MTAFSYVGLFSLFRVWLLHAVFLSHLSPRSFFQGLSSEHFAELESVHLLAFSARACSLAFLSLGVSFLAICRAVLIYLVLFSGFVLSSTPYIGLLCLLRMNAINSCVSDTWQRLWRDDFTHNGKQAQDPSGSLHAYVSSVEWSSLKGRGPRWFTVRKRPALQRHDILTVSLGSFIFYIFREFV